MNAIAGCYTLFLVCIIFVNWGELKEDHKHFARWCADGGWVGLAVYAAACGITLLAMLPWYWL